MGVESSPLTNTSPEVDGLDEGATGDGEVIYESSEENAEEAVSSKKFPDPKLPSPEEVAAHRIDHPPYRSWCKWCIMGRALGEQHKSREDVSTIPVVGMDYFFLTSNGIESVESLGQSRLEWYRISWKLRPAVGRSRGVWHLFGSVWAVRLLLWCRRWALVGANVMGWGGGLGV